jgi:uncharacterized iron-regulated protein
MTSSRRHIVKKNVLTLVVLLFLCFAAGSDVSADNVLRVRDGKIITFSQMVKEVKRVNIVFFGEIHDSIEHHEAELAIIRALHESDTPMSIGLEMFRSNSQDALDFWWRGKSSLEEFLPAYYDNWHMPWTFYREIFWYSRDHEIPLVGLNIPDEIAKKVARQGFASLTEQEKKHLPTGISCNVDATYMEFIRRAYADHSLHEQRFVNFCEAQMVWDKSMARHLVEYLNKNRGRIVVVLAGVGHAWKRGMPEQIAMESKDTCRVILPLVPGQIEKKTVTIKDADYLLLE